MVLLVLLTSGCATEKRSASARSTTDNTRTNSLRQDSTYHYVKDSVVVYLGKPEELENLEDLGELGSVERWHTEYRDRIVTKTDTVFCDRETVVQLPPERYVPRAVKGLAWAGGGAIGLLILWLAWRVKGL